MTPASSPAALVRFRALRGATTASADEPACVASAMRELLAAMTEANGIATQEIVSAIFSATSDVRSLYPAAVAREIGWTQVPMLCVAEMAVDGSPERCLRVLLHLALEQDRPLRPIYLRGARTLRPDLAPAE